MGRRGRAGLALTALLVFVLLAAEGLVGSGGAQGSVPPLLPVGEGNRFVGLLAAPVLTPGSSGTITFEVTNPLRDPLVQVAVQLEVYAFNAYPGNATQMPSPSGGVALENSSGVWAAAASRTVTGPLAPGASAPVSVPAQAPAGAPAGTYAVRLQLTATSNGTVYELRSRGYFDAALWASATTGPNGTSDLNLTRLGVSGVIPETAVLVPPPSSAPVLYAVLGASIVLAAVGGYVLWRRGPGSSSGSVGAPGAKSAESALGNRRTKDGD